MGGGVREGGEGRDSGGELTDVVKVHRDPGQTGTGCATVCGRIRTGDDEIMVDEDTMSPHVLQDGAELVSRLSCLGRPVRDDDAPARDCCGGHKWGGVGQVGLDDPPVRLNLPRRNLPRVRFRHRDVNTRVPQHVDGHLDVRLRGERGPCVRHRNPVSEACRREQQPRNKLRARRRINADSSPAWSLSSADVCRIWILGRRVRIRRRRRPLNPQRKRIALDADTQLTQRVGHGF